VIKLNAAGQNSPGVVAEDCFAFAQGRQSWALWGQQPAKKD